MMSDGLPERLNPAGEPLGYARTQALFSSAATGSPDEMCAHLVRGCNEWADGQPQNDDITLIALKVR